MKVCSVWVGLFVIWMDVKEEIHDNNDKHNFCSAGWQVAVNVVVVIIVGERDLKTERVVNV